MPKAPLAVFRTPVVLLKIIHESHILICSFDGAAASLLLISLAIGMAFAGKYDVASDNYTLVLFCAVGLAEHVGDLDSIY